MIAPRLNLRSPDCLGDPAGLTAAERERCARRAGRPLAGEAFTASSRARQDELDASASRKDQIVTYRNTITAPYPGLNCVFRGKCGEAP